MKTRIAFRLLLVSCLTLSVCAAAPPAPTAKLPKVLIIGDTISEGYTPMVQDNLIKIAEVSHPADNCMHTVRGLKDLKTWLGDEKWDVIHFNFGLFDLTQVTPEQYRANLTKIVTILEGTGAKLIWASTTPLLPKTGKNFKDVLRFNAIAADVMQAHKIPIDDLHSYVTGNLKAWLTEEGNLDGTYWRNKEYEQMARQVTEFIQKALNTPKPK